MNIATAEAWAASFTAQLAECQEVKQQVAMLRVNADRLEAIKRLSNSFPQSVSTLLVNIQSAVVPDAEPEFWAAVGRSQLGVPTMADAFEEGDPFPSGLPDGLLTSLTVPPGYSATFETGIWKYGAKASHVSVASRLVFPVGLSYNPNDGAMHVEIMWWSPGPRIWRRRTFPQDVLASRTSLVNLAKYDVPVTSSTATALVNWFDAFLSVNQNLPSTTIVTRQGWGDNEGEPFFVLGTKVYGSAPPGLKIEAPPGMDDAMRCLTRKGTVEGQLSMLEVMAAAYPNALMTVIASASAPLLGIIDCPPYIYDIGDTTGSGKTTSLMAGGSVWGYTSDRGVSLMQTWNTTQVNAEQIIAFLGNIPLIMNESQLIRNVGEAQTIIHMVTEGVGRGRGAMGGGRQTSKEWRTNVLSSGESTLVERLPGQGVAARCVAVAHRPFGSDCKVNQEAADYVRDCCENNYGWIGSILITYLLSIKEDWSTVREEYKQKWAHIMQFASGSVGFRVAQYIAAIDITRTLLIEALDSHLNSAFDYALYFMEDEAWQSHLRMFVKTAKVDPAEGHFFRMLGYAVNSQSKFLGVGGSAIPVIGGIMTADMKIIHITPQFIAEYLQKFLGESAVDAKVREWIRRGWLLRRAPNSYKEYIRQHSHFKVSGWTVSPEAVRKYMTGDVIGGAPPEPADDPEP